MNCRSIKPAAWEHARQLLVFYFSRRGNLGLERAEDLAQETLLAVLCREEFEFAEEDFPRVCYGFARNIEKRAWCADAETQRADAGTSTIAAPQAKAGGLADAELSVFLDEVLRNAKTKLSEHDRQVLFEDANALNEGKPLSSDETSANRLRVQRHRARMKLARIVGWNR